VKLKQLPAVDDFAGPQFYERTNFRGLAWVGRPPPMAKMGIISHSQF